MHKIKIGIVLFVYLVMISLFLRFDLTLLFNIKQILFVMAGTLLLCLPSVEWKRPLHLSFGTIATSALYVGFIQAFMMIFSTLMVTNDFENFFYKLALNIRPIFYGFCIWVIFSESKEKRKEEVVEERKRESETLTLSECSERFLAIDLTRREAEVAARACRHMSNAEIAAELFISETTVKKHMSNIFSKLGITKREELLEKIDVI